MSLGRAMDKYEQGLEAAWAHENDAKLIARMRDKIAQLHLSNTLNSPAGAEWLVKKNGAPLIQAILDQRREMDNAGALGKLDEQGHEVLPELDLARLGLSGQDIANAKAVKSTCTVIGDKTAALAEARAAVGVPTAGRNA